MRRFLDETIEAARADGLRRARCSAAGATCRISRSRNRTLRQAAERMAVNTVIQGTAADLIKKAMVEVDAALRAARPRARA